jgi:leader peptidase (prepilin peptidase) / N-methyltransferase
LQSLALLYVCWLFALGLCVGSFLNVVIARLPNDESIVRPRSKCPRCSSAIAWYDNIPVISWLLLRGRCRHCKAPISIRYPLIELVTAGLFLAAYSRFEWGWDLVPALVLITLLVPITVIDAEHWIIPHELSVPGMALGPLLAIPGGWEKVSGALLGVAIGFGAFRAMEFLGWVVFKREALGAGDKFLFALIGGFLSGKALLGVILFASVQGSIFGIARMLITGRAGPKVAQEVPEEQVEAQEEKRTMTWAFLRPGVSLPRRLLAIPYALLLQPIPDDPIDEAGEEVDWVPGKSNLPFGPWLAAGAVEVLIFGELLSEQVTPGGLGWFFG